MSPTPPKRRKGETAAKFRDRLANWKIEDAFRRRAKDKFHGDAFHGRNKAWRIASLERNITMRPEDQW